MSKKMNAKYAGLCGNCGGDIQRGDAILWSKADGATHFECEEIDEFRASGYCEDFPCCGHEAGDCFGQKYGSDESIKATAYARMEMEQQGYFIDDEGW